MLTAQLLARRLSDGLYGKLEYDFACQRGHGFGEPYVHGAVVDLLASNIDPSSHSIKTGYAAPELQIERSNGDGRGRKREVDFAVLDRAGSSSRSRIAVCVEVKWAGSSHATPLNILHDLVRLSIIADANPCTVPLFILAGPKSNVQKLLTDQLFDSCRSSRKEHQILIYPPTGKMGSVYRLSSHGPCMSPHLDQRNYELLYKAHSHLPKSIQTVTYLPAHSDPRRWEVQVIRAFSLSGE